MQRTMQQHNYGWYTCDREDFTSHDRLLVKILLASKICAFALLIALGHVYNSYEFPIRNRI